MRSMRYDELPPPSDLAPWVLALWSFEVVAEAGEITHTVPLTGGAILSSGRGGLIVVGPRTRPLHVPVRGGDRFRGALLVPGAHTVLWPGAGARRDLAGPAATVLGPGADEGWPEDELADDRFFTGVTAFLRERAGRSAPLDPRTAAVVARVVGGRGAEPVASLAAAAELSPRQLRRLFHAVVGLSPKELARVVRLRAAAAAAVAGDQRWATVVAEHGFADQPHLVREFRSILGASPEGFRRHARHIDHRLDPP